MTDVLVVGSGAAGTAAAWPLVEAGLGVTLLDVGLAPEPDAPAPPARPWSELRRTDEAQHRYFLGERFEGVPLGPVRVGAQLTPPRRYVTAEADRLLPVEGGAFQAAQSVALGGLAQAWGAGVLPYDDRELAPLRRADLAPHYARVAERIGVAAEDDDEVLDAAGGLAPCMPPLEPEEGAAALLARHRRRGGGDAAFALGVAPLAVCTRAHRGRGPHRYLDLDFWGDPDRSVYRPRWTLEELARLPGFRLERGRLVERFRETAEGVEVDSEAPGGGDRRTHRARALVLAAGALGSARLALRSLGRYDRPVPLLCNAYRYVPLLNLHRLGRVPRDRRHGLAQLTALLRPAGPDGRLVVAQYYAYRSLLAFKLLKETRLAHREALRLLGALGPALAVLGVHHDDAPHPGRACALVRGTGATRDRLEVRWETDAAEERVRRADERAVVARFRRLGCLPLGRVDPGPGASIHYGGTLPLSAEERELTCAPEDGRLRGTRAVHVACGAALPRLSAKGPTLTILAHADRVGARLARALAREPAR